MPKKTLSDVQLAAWKSLLNAHAAAVGEIELRLAVAGEIPLSWYDVLWALRKSGEECCLRFRELQQEIVLSRSALSRLIDSLVRAGLVTKRPCADDARGIDVELTEKGRKALASAWPVYSTGIAEAFAQRLTEADCESLQRILRKVEQAAG